MFCFFLQSRFAKFVIRYTCFTATGKTVQRIFGYCTIKTYLNSDPALTSWKSSVGPVVHSAGIHGKIAGGSKTLKQISSLRSILPAYAGRVWANSILLHINFVWTVSINFRIWLALQQWNCSLTWSNDLRSLRSSTSRNLHIPNEEIFDVALMLCISQNYETLSKQRYVQCTTIWDNSIINKFKLFSCLKLIVMSQM